MFDLALFLPYVAIALIASSITQFTKKIIKRYVKNEALSILLDGRVFPMLIGLVLGFLAMGTLQNPLAPLFGAGAGVIATWVFGTVKRIVEGFQWRK